eukprot:SAG31_NODE_25687_length_456_cov_1.154062_2_plen_57_part_01
MSDVEQNVQLVSKFNAGTSNIFVSIAVKALLGSTAALLHARLAPRYIDIDTFLFPTL